jgi:hypothetical protein
VVDHLDVVQLEVVLLDDLLLLGELLDDLLPGGNLDDLVPCGVLDDLLPDKALLDDLLPGGVLDDLMPGGDLDDLLPGGGLVSLLVLNLIPTLLGGGDGNGDTGRRSLGLIEAGEDLDDDPLLGMSPGVVPEAPVWGEAVWLSLLRFSLKVARCALVEAIAI